LLHSPAWTQMMADAMGRPVVACLESEATSRGAALLALERLGAIREVGELPARLGSRFEPDVRHREAYEQARARHRRLYAQLFEQG